ncbi:FxLD family lanthipeptide [Streptomyces sp. NPDC005122]
MASATAPLDSVEVPLVDEWDLDTTITHSPTPIVDGCDTSDGCESSCASSCASD